ncbi:hypothetical protein CDAR_5011 [Caerostris darwini]|uniref:Uncharacterized protein n=1 Tax=Caerostris darwini TaxID=1538125 RepID=A0AAV4P416_9ARAC|nr:hypothetical protein CDAR_5011 [Caerostris darwini]
MNIIKTVLFILPLFFLCQSESHLSDIGKISSLVLSPISFYRRIVMTRHKEEETASLASEFIKDGERITGRRQPERTHPIFFRGGEPFKSDDTTTSGTAIFPGFENRQVKKQISHPQNTMEFIPVNKFSTNELQNSRLYRAYSGFKNILDKIVNTILHLKSLISIALCT